MNEVYGPLFEVSKAEAATPALAQERATALKDQFIMDMHTHFLRDDTRIMTFVNMRNAVGKAGWNKQLSEREQTVEDLKFNNYKKEMFLDSDTKISLISSAPSDIEQDWFLTNEQMAEARKKINEEAGARRVFCSHDLHARPAGLARQARCRRSRSSPNPARATRSATTPTRKSAVSLAHGRRKGGLQGLREDGDGGHQERLRAQGAVCAGCGEAIPAICAATPMLPTSARRRRIGRSLTSSSITRPIATSAATRRMRWRSSSAPAASPGPAISPTSRRSTASTTSMATSASCSRRRWSPSRTCAPH